MKRNSLKRYLRTRTTAQWKTAINKLPPTHPDAIQWGKQIAFFDYPKAGRPKSPGRLVANKSIKEETIKVLVTLGYPETTARKRMLPPRDHH